MLLRMYLRWAERNEFKTEVLDIQAGEEAGIRGVTLRVGELSSFDLEAETGEGSTTFRDIKLDLDDFRDDGGYFVRGRQGSKLRIATSGGDLVVRHR